MRESLDGETIVDHPNLRVLRMHVKVKFHGIGEPEANQC